MTHEQLSKLSGDREFELAKHMIMEGISARLTSFEKTDCQKITIRTEPRVKYEEQQPRALTTEDDYPQSYAKGK